MNMLKFEPPELEAELRHALVELTDEISVRFGGEEIEGTFDSDEFDDQTFTASTQVTLSFQREDADTDFSIQDLIEFAGELTDSHTSFDGLV